MKGGCSLSGQNLADRDRHPHADAGFKTAAALGWELQMTKATAKTEATACSSFNIF